VAPAITHFLVGAAILLSIAVPLAMRYDVDREHAIWLVPLGGIWGLAPDAHHIARSTRRRYTRSTTRRGLTYSDYTTPLTGPPSVLAITKACSGRLSRSVSPPGRSGPPVGYDGSASQRGGHSNERLVWRMRRSSRRGSRRWRYGSQ